MVRVERKLWETLAVTLTGQIQNGFVTLVIFDYQFGVIMPVFATGCGLVIKGHTQSR